MKKSPGNYIILASILSVLIFSTYGISRVLGNISAQPAAVYFTESVTTEDLHNQFNRAKVGLTADPIRILIIPGHEPDYGGTEYKLLKERDLNVDLATQLHELLDKDEAFESVLARDKTDWYEPLADFLDNEQEGIAEFVAQQKNITAELVEAGELEFPDKVKHGDAPQRVALLLYGINQWASEENFDIILNIHLNDTGGRKISKNWPSGFVIYVPDPQFSNARASYDIAEYIVDRMSLFYSVSNLSQEEDGVVINEKLIALGANNTLDPASLLIEYGYIYERKFQEKSVREKLITDFAHQTYLGISDFFGSRDVEKSEEYTTLTVESNSLNLPLKKSKDRNSEVLILQAMLLQAGFFPHDGTLEDCPLDGVYGNCTSQAVTSLQESMQLKADGIVGEETHRVLEELI